MGESIRWLMDDEQKTLYGIVFAIALNLVFLALSALLLWPLDRAETMAFRLAKGYVLLWLIVSLAATLLNLIQRFSRVNIYDHADAYVNSNLAVSCFLQAGWSAFAALVVRDSLAAAGTPVWLVVVLYLAGILSCFVAFNVVSAFYQGQIYRIISLPLAFVSFIIFSLWPMLARVTYGRFFDLF